MAVWHSVVLIILFGASALLTGCSGLLKPARSEARYFVLTPVTESAGIAEGRLSAVVGVGRIKMPAYLASSSLAVRHGTNEIEYLPATLWGERLDNGFQRVLGANLAALSPATQIRQSAWGSHEVTAEIYVSIEQFDLDASGRGVLVAWWRVVSPGGEKTLKVGESRFSRQGATPDSDPAGAVATLSELVADLSRLLAGILREVGPGLGVLPN